MTGGDGTEGESTVDVTVLFLINKAISKENISLVIEHTFCDQQ
jgi:hypothetical protein